MSGRLFLNLMQGRHCEERGDLIVLDLDNHNPSEAKALNFVALNKL